MKVKVEVYGFLRNLMGCKSIELDVDENTTLEQLLDSLMQWKPEVKEALFEGGELREYVKILVDGRDCRALEGLRSKLHDNCVVSIFPPAGGG